LLRASERFDLCLLDFSIPGSRCVEVVGAIRATASGHALPLLVLSSVTATRGDLEQLALQRIPIHQKPIKGAALRQAVGPLLAARPRAAQPDRPRLDPSTASRHPVQILIVEDQAANQLVLARMLERLGYQSDVADNGLEAIERLAHRHYNLVLMDLQMPHIDGYEATRRIRARHGHAFQIVGVSAHASDDARSAAIEAGMDSYLTKPYTVAQLQEVLGGVSPGHPGRPDKTGPT